MNKEVSTMLEKVISVDKETELSKIMDADVKNGIQCGALRDYYLASVHKAESQMNNATWCTAYLVTSIVRSDNFNKAFKDQNDLAECLGYNKSTISKMLGVVELKDYLFDKGYVGAYTVGQLSELLPEYRECKRKELDILPMLDHMVFNEKMTSKQVREGIKAWKNTLVTVKEPVEEESVEDAEVETESVEDAEFETESAETLQNAINAFIDQIKTVDINFKNKSNKKTVLKIKDDQIGNLMKYLISKGIVTLE